MNSFHRSLFFQFILLFLITIAFTPKTVQAQYTKKVIMVSSKEVPGIPGAKFSTAVPPSGIGLSDSGKIVFSAYLEIGPGGITSETNQGIWVYEAATIRLLAQKGGPVPRFTQTYFNGLPKVFMDPLGNIAIDANYVSGGGTIFGNGIFIEENGVLVQKLYSDMVFPSGDTIVSIDGVAFNNGRVLFTGGLKARHQDLFHTNPHSASITMIILR